MQPVMNQGGAGEMRSLCKPVAALTGMLSCAVMSLVLDGLLASSGGRAAAGGHDDVRVTGLGSPVAYESSSPLSRSSPRPGAEQDTQAAALVARVNGAPVTRAELRRLMGDAEVRARLEQAHAAETPDSASLDDFAIRKLIHRQLFLQEAARRNLMVSVVELDRAISALRQHFPDLGSFGAWMREQGLDDRSLIDSLRDDILTARAMGALLEGVEVSAQQVQDYYASHREDLVTGEEVRLRLIVVASKEAARGILTDLRQGENFSRLARTRSLGQRATQGGDTGWVDTRSLPAPLREVVAGLKPGEASHPQRKDGDQFLLVGLEGRRPLRPKDLDEARPAIRRRLLADKQQNTLETWLAEQENRSWIELLPGTENAHRTSDTSRDSFEGEWPRTY